MRKRNRENVTEKVMENITESKCNSLYCMTWLKCKLERKCDREKMIGNVTEDIREKKFNGLI